jgi:hypothetical protein
MDRREAVRLVGAVVAIPFLPRAVSAAAALAQRTHALVQGGTGFRTFNTAQQALVSSLCDAIIPRTDTPGAGDVRVPEFIDHIITDWASDGERGALLEGLADIDVRAEAGGRSAFVRLDATRQARLLTTLDAERTSGRGAGHAFGQIKSLAVYAYFTSEVVQRDVLKTQMFFSEFNACAPAQG